MEIIGSTLHFKSKSPFFEKEHSGKKSNTVRRLSYSEINT